MRIFVPCFALVLLAGCAGPSELMPLETGHSWTYHVFTGLRTYVEPIRVVRRVAVGSVSGFELEGPLGTARLAWEGKKLVAERLGTSRFDPPLPLLMAAPTGSMTWTGLVGNLTGNNPAEATLTQTLESLPVGSQTFKTTKSTLNITSNGHKIELVTWFSAGTGIVRQEQRTDGRQNLAIEHLSGP